MAVAGATSGMLGWRNAQRKRKCIRPYRACYRRSVGWPLAALPGCFHLRHTTSFSLDKRRNGESRCRIFGLHKMYTARRLDESALPSRLEIPKAWLTCHGQLTLDMPSLRKSLKSLSAVWSMRITTGLGFFLGFTSRGLLGLALQALAYDLQHDAVFEHPRTDHANPLLLDVLQSVWCCFGFLAGPPELSEMAARLYTQVQIASMLYTYIYRCCPIISYSSSPHCPLLLLQFPFPLSKVLFARLLSQSH